MDILPLTIMHLSDLHFGRISQKVLFDLETFIRSRKEEIHLAILTGDLTQRARSHEFKQARDFLNTLGCPLFLVPGNHDVPLYNIFLRLFSPYKKFLKYIGPFATNFYEDERVAVYGLWTTDNYTIKTGKISTRDLREAEAKLSKVSPDKIRIIASHHPLTSINHPRIKSDLLRLTSLSPHFFLWGHEHHAQVHEMVSGKSYIVASGTSASTRTRSEANSFNLIRLEGRKGKVEIYRHSHQMNLFEPVEEFPLDFNH